MFYHDCLVFDYLLAEFYRSGDLSTYIRNDTIENHRSGLKHVLS